MKLLLVGAALALGLIALVATRRGPPAPRLATPGEPLDDAVPLSVRETSSRPEVERTFEIEFRNGADTARFGLMFVPKPVPEDGPAAFTKGSLVSHRGSHTSAVMLALARAHGAQSAKAGSDRHASIGVDVGYFGDQLHKGPGRGTVIAGAFTTEPVGTWTVLKLFVPSDGDEPGELFVALDPSSGHGLFLVKDPEYWTILEGPLRTVL